MSDREFQIAIGVLEDCRRGIAAGKAQRWDVVKWGIGVNLALATASFALPAISPFLVLLAVIVAGTSLWFVRYYNQRMTEVRRNSLHVVRLISAAGIDYDALAGVNTADAYSTGANYDKHELFAFTFLLAISPAAAFIRSIWWVCTGQ